MAAEAIWQARGRDSSDRGWTSYTPARADREPIERLLRRLIDRVEQIDRRYGETLEELQARLGHYSEAADTLSTASSPEESDTLERLRQQLSSLADRLGQPKPAKRSIGGLETLNHVLNEAAKETDGIARGPGYSSPSSVAGALDFPPLFAERTGQNFEPARDLDGTRTSPDLDRQLAEMAGRLERSINDAIPIGAIESIDRRMRELAHRFDAALEHSPRHETLRHLEGQISGLGDQVTRVEQHMSRIGAVEGALQRLVQHFEGTPAQIADAARDAANEAARLVAGGSGDAAEAAERLDAIHRDLVAMRDRSDTAGVRMVDTLAAVHDSLKALVRQLERGENGSSTNAASDHDGGKSPASSAAGGGSRSPFSFEHGSLGSSLGQGSRETADDLAEAHSNDSAADAAGATAEPSKTPSIDDFVAAARRAAQAAAAERDGMTPSHDLGSASRRQGRRKGPVLAVMASILLVIAAFLYVHLGPKLEPLILPPAAELISPAPARTGAKGLESLPVVPAFRPEEPMPQAPVTPATNDDAPEVLPWRTETIPAEDHPLAVGQAIFPDRDERRSH